MKILTEYKGYQLLERYGNQYLRFWGGREEDMPCEIPVSAEEASEILENPVLIDECITKAKSKIVWTAESFYEIGIVEYLRHFVKMSDKRIEKNYDKFSRHIDIRNEFYQYVMNEAFPTTQIEVAGYTAEQLEMNYPLSPLGAYNYLIYLREMPEQALKDLKSGLSTKDTLHPIMDEKKEEQLSMDEKNPVQNDVEEAKVPATPISSEKELLEKLDALQQAMAGLQQSFDDKIAEDTHKNGLFDNMHRELIRYQNGALEKIVDTVALDIIQLVDTTKGHVRVYEKKEANEENYKKLLRIVKGIAEDLEDILYRQNIESYRVPGHEVDVRRQKIIQTVPTDDKSKDNLVAVRAADGYEKGDKVLRPERIKIFKYEASSETPSEK